MIGEPFTIDDWDHKVIGKYGGGPALEVAWKVTITNHTFEDLHCSIDYTWLDEDGFPLADTHDGEAAPARSTTDIGGQWPVSKYKMDAVGSASVKADCY